MKTDKIRLLLVEDDQDFGKALISRLLKRGFEVTAASSAEIALNKIEETKPQVIVADIKLPGMDGVKFLAKVREIDANLPVILITGYASLESAKEAVKLNAADYLLKPLENIEELINPVYKAAHSYKLESDNQELMRVLRVKIKELERKNIALGEILERIEVEKKRIKDDIFINIDKLILPVLRRFKRKAGPSEVKYIDVLYRNIEELAASFGRKITGTNLKLTPREIEICNMVKSGLASKDIAKLLNVSRPTIERHRNNIRKKLGIVNKSVNLTSYLQTY